MSASVGVPIMYALLRVFCVALLVFPAVLMAGEGHHHDDASVDAERAICNVCRVHDGENEPEPVVATANFEDTSYGFCSEGCRDRFLEAPASYVPPVFPRPAPGFAMHDLDGNEVSSDSLKGKVVLLDFWATWCPPCLKDLPKLTELHERYQASGFVVVSLSIDEADDAVRKVRRAIKRRKARHPVYLDTTDTSAWAAYGVRAVPTQFLIDGMGQIVGQWSGKIDLEVVEAAVVEVLNEDSGC